MEFLLSRMTADTWGWSWPLNWFLDLFSWPFQFFIMDFNAIFFGQGNEPLPGIMSPGIIVYEDIVGSILQIRPCQNTFDIFQIPELSRHYFRGQQPRIYFFKIKVCLPRRDFQVRYVIPVDLPGNFGKRRIPHITARICYGGCVSFQKILTAVNFQWMW
mgnify:CR=1 FL=1